MREPAQNPRSRDENQQQTQPTYRKIPLKVLGLYNFVKGFVSL